MKEPCLLCLCIALVVIVAEAGIKISCGLLSMSQLGSVQLDGRRNVLGIA
jgi:hypothetical protein